MASFFIEVIGITGPTFVKTPRGGYNFLEIAYKKDGKVEGKKLIDFANKGVFNFMKSAKQGDKFKVTAEKDANDFWQWTVVSAADEGSEQASTEAATETGGSEVGSKEPAPSGTSTGGGRGKVTGSNYETSDERALRREFDRVKHRQIGRQGCINSAINFMNANFKETTQEDILETAKFFEAYVFDEKA